MVVASLLETAMLVLFGFSWPINIIKSWKARTARGISVLFYYLIDAGYVAGLTSKIIQIVLSDGPWYEVVPWYVLTVYIINLTMVTCGILIYYRNRAFDEAFDND